MSKTILMPPRAAGMEERTISRWLKNERDIVTSSKPVAEIVLASTSLPVSTRLEALFLSQSQSACPHHPIYVAPFFAVMAVSLLPS